jgi:Zn-dependent protease with chaperone function
VVLHEAGHYVMWHLVKELTVGIILFIIGIIILKRIKNLNKSIIFSIFLGLLFGILLVQIGKYHELQADKYTVKRISNPEGMIGATERFRDYHGKKYSQNQNSVIQFLFYRADPYDNRIKMAREEIEYRNNK